MYLARFSYDVMPANREDAMGFIRREVEAAGKRGLKGRLLVPLTRGPDGAALQYEVEMASLDQFEQLRQHGSGNSEETAGWMRAFSQILLKPPEVELLRVDG